MSNKRLAFKMSKDGIESIGIKLMVIGGWRKVKGKRVLKTSHWEERVILATLYQSLLVAGQKFSKTMSSPKTETMTQPETVASCPIRRYEDGCLCSGHEHSSTGDKHHGCNFSAFPSQLHPTQCPERRPTTSTTRLGTILSQTAWINKWTGKNS
jgi:hypothetical protein